MGGRQVPPTLDRPDRLQADHPLIRRGARDALTADDEVVVDVDLEQLAGVDDLAGHVDVGLAGRRVAGRVVVDHPYGPHNVLIYMIYFA